MIDSIKEQVKIMFIVFPNASCPGANSEARLDLIRGGGGSKMSKIHKEFIPIVADFLPNDLFVFHSITQFLNVIQDWYVFYESNLTIDMND